MSKNIDRFGRCDLRLASILLTYNEDKLRGNIDHNLSFWDNTLFYDMNLFCFHRKIQGDKTYFAFIIC